MQIINRELRWKEKQILGRGGSHDWAGSGQAASHLAELSRLCSSISMKVLRVWNADIQRHWFTEMEALITGTNTRVMWGRQSRTREAPTGQGAKMEAAGEQDEAVCVCAENQRKKNTNTGVCAASRRRWCSDRGFEIVKSPLDYLLDARMKDLPFNFYGNRFNLGLLFVALLRTAAAVYPRRAAGCDMRSIRYGVDLLVRVVVWLNWRFYVIITAF